MLKRIVTALVLVGMLPLSAYGQVDELERCLIEIRSLTKQSESAGYPPMFAINYLLDHNWDSLSPTVEQLDACQIVNNKITKWWTNVTDKLKASEREETASPPVSMQVAPQVGDTAIREPNVSYRTAFGFYPI